MKKNTLIIILLLLNNQAFTQDKNENLVTLIRQTLERSSRVKELQQQVLVGDYRTKVIETALKPQVTGEVGYNRIDPVGSLVFAIPGFPERAVKFGPNNAINTNVGVSYGIYDWGKTTTSAEKSKLETQLAGTNVEGMKTQLAYQVANLYYGIIYSKKAIEVQKEQLKLIEDNSKVIEDRLKNGDALEYDKVSIQVRYKNAETRLVDLQSQLERQHIYLDALVGYDTRDKILANDFALDLSANAAESAFDAAQNHNIELQALKDRVAIAEKEISLAKIGSLPNLMFLAQVGLKNGFPDAETIETLKFNTIAGLKLTIPIFTGNKSSYQTSIAKINKDAIGYATQTTNTALRRDIEVALNDMKTANEKLELSERNVFQAQYALKLADTRFKNGVITPVEIEIAQNGLREAQFTQLQYQYQSTLAKLELNRLMGSKFW